MQSIVGTEGIVETYMVTTFPVLRFFFGIVGRTIGTVGRLEVSGRNPPVNFKDTALLMSLCVASATGRPDPTTLVQAGLLSRTVSQTDPKPQVLEVVEKGGDLPDQTGALGGQ